MNKEVPIQADTNSPHTLCLLHILRHLHIPVLHTLPKLPTHPHTPNLTITPTEHSFLAMLANLVLTVTMANVVPNGDTVESVILSLFKAMITVENLTLLMQLLIILNQLILLVILLATLQLILLLIPLLITLRLITPLLISLPLITLQVTPLLTKTTITVVITTTTEPPLECAILTKTANTENVTNKPISDCSQWGWC